MSFSRESDTGVVLPVVDARIPVVESVDEFGSDLHAWLPDIRINLNTVKLAHCRLERVTRRDRMLHRKNSRVRARFEPKVPEALLPELAVLAGTEANFVFVRRMDDDEPYPDEWVLRAEDPRFGEYTIPESDLNIIGSEPARPDKGAPSH